MWQYYKANPAQSECRFHPDSDLYRQYRADLDQLWSKGIIPKAFDTNYYLSLYPDVANYSTNGKDPPAYHHWLHFGIYELRKYRFLENCLEALPEASIEATEALPFYSECLALAIQGYLSKFQLHKAFRQQLTELITGYLTRLISQTDKGSSLWDWSPPQISDFVFEVLRIINLKGCLDHFSNGMTTETILKVLQMKLLGDHERIKAHLQLLTLPVFDEALPGLDPEPSPKIKAKMPIQVPIQANAPPLDDFYEFIKEVQERSINATLSAYSQHQAMKLDQTHDFFRQAYEKAMNEITASIKELVVGTTIKAPLSASKTQIIEILPEPKAQSQPGNKWLCDYVKRTMTQKCQALGMFLNKDDYQSVVDEFQSLFTDAPKQGQREAHMKDLIDSYIDHLLKEDAPPEKVEPI